MAVTREAIVPNPGVVQVSTKNGEHLYFRLEAAGPIPVFAFSSSAKGTLREAPEFPDHPTVVYEWVHLKNPSGIQHIELLDLLMAFLTSAAYRYFAEIRNSEGAALRTVLDVKYTSGDPNDTASEAFNVVTTQEETS